ncbi:MULTISPECIES: serine hydrolase [Lactobacillus]|uniref:Serine hydrolase n=1 Tax=Lactobacillus xujianguonis TaxID=2495899 RepID=A0A437ST55_9LACO|nr:MULTISPECIES: serine hydrolase [Lactobacillus]RVU70136.1 serine hydrolase [Lactobacillus xujianguonis]RVU73354.1 serine hydrolase [Lactobacillus xujianguonis]
MKNKVFIRALIATLFAFMLYSTNLHRVQNAKLQVVEPKSAKVAKKKKAKEPAIKEPRAPKITSPEYATKVTVEKGSQKRLARKIRAVMGKHDTYQVAVQDLNNSSRFVRLSNSQRIHGVNGIMRLYLLIAIYKQEQTGKLSAHTAIKVKKADRVKGEKMFQPNIGYGIAYLRDAMMRGNKTAANTLLRKIGMKNINRIIKEFHITQTKMVGKFTSSPVGKTTANNLDATLKGIYQGRVLKRQGAYNVLGAMHGQSNKLNRGLSGTIYSLADSNAAVAIVQTSGRSYSIAVWSNSNKNFTKLGKTVSAWFNK